MTFARTAVCFVLFAVFAIGSPAQTWKQVAELTPTSRQTSDWFGIALASSASTIAVADFDPNFESFGSVDIYVKPASGWSNATQSAMLIPDLTGEICTKWNERKSTWRKSWSCPSRGTSQSKS